MKLRIKELNPNPYKKEINNGKLNKEIVKKIKANIKDLGLMGSLPIFKKDKKYYLISGHHRIQALKETYGDNIEVECTLHNYSDENILRGMVVENLTQRADELMEVTENLNAIRKFLKSNVAVHRVNTDKQLRDKKGKFQDEAGSIREVYNFLSKNGEIMSIGKISQYLKVYDNLDRNLLKKAIKTEGGVIEEETISVKEAINLSRVPKEEQRKMKEILDKTDLNKDAKGKLITEYLESPEEMKERVLKEEFKIEELPIENLKAEIKKKAEEELKNEEGVINVTHYKKFLRDAGNRVGETNDKILNTCAFLDGLEKSGVLYELDWNTMYRVLEIMTTGGKRYFSFGEKIMNKI